jgi:hypothetical protein
VYRFRAQDYIRSVTGHGEHVDRKLPFELPGVLGGGFARNTTAFADGANHSPFCGGLFPQITQTGTPEDAFEPAKGDNSDLGRATAGPEGSTRPEIEGSKVSPPLQSCSGNKTQKFKLARGGRFEDQPERPSCITGTWI